MMDAVIALLSSAVSQDKGAALDGVTLRWGRVASESASYRETTVRDLALENEDELRREAIAFLRVMGADDRVIEGVQRARVRYDGHAITVSDIERERANECERALRGLCDRA